MNASGRVNLLRDDRMVEAVALGWTLKAAGEIGDVSPERVRQIVSKRVRMWRRRAGIPFEVDAGAVRMAFLTFVAHQGATAMREWVDS
jgi:hypothetical protein